MKFYSPKKEKKYVSDGDIRIINHFCLLPYRDGDIVYWLETILIKQRAIHRYDPSSGSEWINWEDIEVL